MDEVRRSVAVYAPPTPTHLHRHPSRHYYVPSPDPTGFPTPLPSARSWRPCNIAFSPESLAPAPTPAPAPANVRSIQRTILAGRPRCFLVAAIGMK